MCATIEEIMTLSKIPFQKLFRALQNHKFWVTKLKYVNTHSVELLLNIFWSHFTIHLWNICFDNFAKWYRNTQEHTGTKYIICADIFCSDSMNHMSWVHDENMTILSFQNCWWKMQLSPLCENPIMRVSVSLLFWAEQAITRRHQLDRLTTSFVSKKSHFGGISFKGIIILNKIMSWQQDQNCL